MLFLTEFQSFLQTIQNSLSCTGSESISNPKPQNIWRACWIRGAFGRLVECCSLEYFSPSFRNFRLRAQHVWYKTYILNFKDEITHFIFDAVFLLQTQDYFTLTLFSLCYVFCTCTVMKQYKKTLNESVISYTSFMQFIQAPSMLKLLPCPYMRVQL